MRTTLTASAWVMGILAAAIFGCLTALSFAPKMADAAQPAGVRQMVAKAGMDYLLNLRKEGRLPGLTTNEHGNACISGQLTRDPYSLSTRFNTEGEASTNHYNIVQVKQGSPWQLKRAWRTDSNGQILQEWPVN